MSEKTLFLEKTFCYGLLLEENRHSASEVRILYPFLLVYGNPDPHPPNKLGFTICKRLHFYLHVKLYLFSSSDFSV